MDPIEKYTNLDKDAVSRWDRQYLWHPFTQHSVWNRQDPLVIVAAEGDYLIDADGRRYIDGVASLWCVVHGHRKGQIDAAIRAQLDRMAHSTLLGLTHPLAAVLARRLVEIAPAGLTKVFYSDDGSTAVEVALKMAYAYWVHRGQPQRNRFVALQHSYHGDTLGAVSVGGIELFHDLFRPLLFETLFAPAPYCYRCALGRSPDSCGLACADELGRILEQNRQRVAGVILEPLMQCAGGMIAAPPGYLKKVEQHCRRSGALLIADEVATGFGRTGTMFACQQEEVSPDLMCIGKGLTNGYLPLAATLAAEQIYSAFVGEVQEWKTFWHGHTFTGNPLGCAAALANLDLFEAEGLLESLPAKIERIRDRLAEMHRRSRWIGDVRQWGMIAGIEIVADRQTRRAFPYELQVGASVCMAARKYGLILRPLADVIVIFPPLGIALDTLDRMLYIIEHCIDEVVPALAGRCEPGPE